MALPSHSSSFSYHVFLSFRGEDTRHGFTGHLYKALTDKGFHTFFDEEELRSGEEITPALENAIQESRIAIIVLSKQYASSSFCLHELDTIIHCAQSKGLLVIPVFYMVDPSDVRHLRGSYEDVLTKHERRFPDKLQKWKEALRKVADLSGFHFKQGDAYEYKFIGNIVNTVSNDINHRGSLHVGDYLVGLESRVQEVMKLLDVGSDDIVLMVGIHGMGGIGKSTLARAVYDNLIAEKFNGSCYLGNVREKSENHGLEHIQQILLQEILRDEKINVTSVDRGASMIEERLKRKKVLLVLDDIDHLEQLEAIVGSPEWFGPGSRVIITTRDWRLLVGHQVERRYEVKTLNYNDSRQLLIWRAFKKQKTDPTHVEVLDRVLNYASGLPLALKIIGTHLSGMTVEEWKSAIKGYERIPNDQILDILKISFNALKEGEKSIFLDISCCFKGYALEKVEDILCARYGNCMKYQIRVLIEKSLIKLEKSDRVTLHDLIEEMGKAVVRQESPEDDPAEQSRLWLAKDIIQVLEGNMGNSKIEIIHLDEPISNRMETIEWDGNGFKEMKSLKILIIKNVQFTQGPKCLPNSLRVLEWWAYPSNCLPSDFQPRKFVMLNLSHGSFTSFELDRSSKMFPNLKFLKFDRCYRLTQIGDMSGLKILEKLSFSNCDNLVTVHESVGRLGKLKEISAENCRSLVSFPPIHSTSLEYLNLSSTGLEKFPEWRRYPSNCLPSYFQPDKFITFNLPRFTSFQLDRSPKMLQSLKVLKFDGCNRLTQIGDLSALENLEKLSFDSCYNLVTVHESIGHLGKLKGISVERCCNLVSFPAIHSTSLEYLNLSSTGLENFPEWRGYPLNCLPSDFQPDEFVTCNLPHGCFTSSELDCSSKMFHNLKVLKFDWCYSLTHIGDVSGLKILEKLSFNNCHNLVTLHQSVGHLDKVKEISVERCRNLVGFPPIHLTTLEELKLSHTGLESFPEISGKMENIRRIQLDHTPIKELPISFGNLIGLQELFMHGCGIVKLPSNILMMPALTKFIGWDWKGMKWVKVEENEEAMGSIVWSIVYLSFPNCNLGDDFFSIGFTWIAHVEHLNLSKNNFTFLPECIKEFQSLRSLDVSYCKNLEEIRGVPPDLKSLRVSNCLYLKEIRGIPSNMEYFNARDCKSLTSLPRIMLINEESHAAQITDFCLPGLWIPLWFEHISRGPSTCFWSRNKFPTKILCLLVAPLYDACPTVFINGKEVENGPVSPPFVNTTSKRKIDHKYISAFMKTTNEGNMDHTYISELKVEFYLPKFEMDLEKEWNHVEITYANCEIDTSIIKRMGIHVFKQESCKKDIRFTDPCQTLKVDNEEDRKMLKRKLPQ